MNREYTLSDFDFSLPPELIAQRPLAERTASRLLHVAPEGLHDRHFADIEHLMAPGDVLVFNNTQVLRARLFGRKPTGGKVEALIERVLDTHQALALVRTSHTPLPGQDIVFGQGTQTARATVRGRQDNFFLLEFSDEVLPTLDALGHMPLPPYIQGSDAAQDQRRYQTVYAQEPGAVAAPTAGLHFSQPLLERLRAHGVHLVPITLHVGAGTFQPVRTERIAEHVMHQERYSIGADAAAQINAARARGARITAVGTTSLRALAKQRCSLHLDTHFKSWIGSSPIFICPNPRFSCWCAPLLDSSASTPLMPMPSQRATGSSVMATRCCCNLKVDFVKVINHLGH